MKNNPKSAPLPAFDYYLAQFVDIHGRPKAKLVPAAHAGLIASPGAGFAGFAIAGLGMGPQDQEFMAVGDPSAARPLSWMPGVAAVACDGHVSGQPWALDSRVIAKAAIARFKKATGCDFQTGLEPEFFLLKANGTGWQVATDSSVLDKPCYDFNNLSSVAPVLQELQAALAQAGLDVYQIDHEDANGQFEMNYVFGDALATADKLTFFKMAASGIAKQHGLLASFMPKPFGDRSGSGMHMHMSARVSAHTAPKAGKTRNAFEDTKDPRGLALSAMGYQFLAGLLAHAHALTAIAAPTVNSYKRLVSKGSKSGATWAPVHVAYGNNNRTAFVRGPGGRLELRVGDSAANPYLLTAAVIHAGLDGIERQLNPGEPCNDNLYTLSAADLKKRGVGRLPTSLGQSLAALNASSVLKNGLGQRFVDVFTEEKQQEIDSLALDVSPKELAKYVDFF